MNRCARTAFLCAVATVLSSAAMRRAEAYLNPIPNIVNVADPDILKCEGAYYLYPTTNVIGGHPDTGVRCWYSTDLVNWEPKGWALLTEPGWWSQHNLWGPHVVYRDGFFYMFYSAANIENGPMRVCVARSASPLGPFTEYCVPLFEDRQSQIDAFVFTEQDGKTYLYWVELTGTSNEIWAQQLAPDFRSLTGPLAQSLVGAPFAPWEIENSGYPINEATSVLKCDGVYYLLYSGNVYASPDYAVGYATGLSPLGPFVKYAGNPVLKKDLSLSPPVSGPGAACVTWSPDGSEMFLCYATHTDPDHPGGDHMLNLDRMTITSGVLSITGPTRTEQPDPSSTAGQVVVPVYWDDPFTTGVVQPAGSTTGWTVFGANVPGFAMPDYDPVYGAYLGRVASNPTRSRITGVASGQSEWLPYSAIGTGNYVRVKYHVYCGGQADPTDLNQIPNFRVRAATRFALSSTLEVFHHLRGDSSTAFLSRELRPSGDPTSPSIYRVDFDPVDVPYLASHSSSEGIMRALEAYALEPIENGYVGMTECLIGVYPASALPDSTDSSILLKTYEPTQSDAGNLKVTDPATELFVYNMIGGTFEGDPPIIDTSDSTRATYSEAGLATTSGLAGITFDSRAVASNRIALINRELHPGPDRRAPSYVRVEEGKQYKIRWHVTSVQNSNVNAQFRMRARAIKFAWSQKLSVGGAWATGGTTLNANNTIAQQALPGLGCQNPDKYDTENGGWYTMLFNTPMSVDIRPEFPPGTPLSARMPNISSQPGPGINASSRRDLRLGVDLIDTESAGANDLLEAGHFTLDRIEIRRYDLLPD